MSKRAMSAEDELRELARLGKRLRQMQKHAAKSKTADRAALARMEAEFDKALVAATDFRTADIPWEQPAEANG